MRVSKLSCLNGPEPEPTKLLTQPVLDGMSQGNCGSGSSGSQWNPVRLCNTTRGATKPCAIGTGSIAGSRIKNHTSASGYIFPSCIFRSIFAQIAVSSLRSTSVARGACRYNICSWHGEAATDAFGLPSALVVGEIEQLILDDRTTDGATELLPFRVWKSDPRI